MSVPGEFRGSDQLSDRDYEAIEQAVLESARGRWFLSEHAKRNRTADTLILLDALKRIENSVSERPLALPADFSTISATRTEIAAVRNHMLPDGGKIENDPAMFNNIAEQSKASAAALMSSIETLQRIAQVLRSHVPNAPECEAFDHEISRLQTLAWTSDVQSQRIGKVMSLISHLEGESGGQAVSPKLTAKNLEFFKADEDIFESETLGQPKGSTPSEPRTGRIIVKQFGRAIAQKPHEAEDQTSLPKQAIITELRPPPAAESSPKSLVSPDKPRITIVHRAATEEIYIPLASETSTPR